MKIKTLIRSMAIHKEDNENDHTTEPPPLSWEVLNLLGPYMDPQTLAVASCVSHAWWKCFSSEDQWKTKQTVHEPFNFAAAKETSENISYKRIVPIVESAAKRRRKTQPADPKISLSDLVFTVYVSSGLKEATVVKKGKDLAFGYNEPFQIEADVRDSGFVIGMKEVRMVLQVTYGDNENVFRVMDFTRSSGVETSFGWFTEELPTPRNSYLRRSNVVGDVRPSFKGDVLDKVGFSIADSSSWESLFVDEVLRYLQCFLVDC